MSNDVIQIIIRFVVTFLFSLLLVMIAATIMSYLDRKVQAYVQDRYGPLHYGPAGTLQPIWDVAKLLLKENVKATASDSIVFMAAPLIFFAPILTTFVVVPFSPYLTGGALATGLVFYVAMSSVDVMGVFMAGWGSNNKYALIGGLRAAAQMISYELPLILALVPVVMFTSILAPACEGAGADLSRCGVGSISFTQIVAAQMRPEAPWLWFALLAPVGLFAYYICGLAETNRTPFDLPEAESELVAGYLTEYSGLRWAMFFLGEYGNMCIVSAVATVAFLGGWSGPGASAAFWTGILGSFGGQLVFNIIAAFWFIAKMSIFLFAFMLIRATVPRLRADQLMRFAWLVLIPLTLVNILLTAVLLLLPVDLNMRLIIAGAVNWVLFLVVLVSFRRLTGIRLGARMPARSATARAAARMAAKPATKELAGTAR